MSGVAQYRGHGSPDLDGLTLATGLFDPALALGNASSVLVKPATCGRAAGRALIVLRSMSITTAGTPVTVEVYKRTNTNNAAPGRWLMFRETGNDFAWGGPAGWASLPLDPATGEPWRLEIVSTGASLPVDIEIDYQDRAAST